MIDIRLDIRFCSDGDFYFLAFDKSDLIDTSSQLYGGCIKDLSYGLAECESYIVRLHCSGDYYKCKYAVRDVLDTLLCEGIRCNNHYVLRSLYDMLSKPLDEVIWSENVRCYYDDIGGNYDGTYINILMNHLDDEVNDAKGA